MGRINRISIVTLGLGLVAWAGAAASGRVAEAGSAKDGPTDWPAMDNVPPASMAVAQPGTGRVRASRRLVFQAEMQAQRILETLTLDQKIGQITQGEIQAVTPADVEQYCLGSMLNGGGSWPNDQKRSSAQTWRSHPG